MDQLRRIVRREADLDEVCTALRYAAQGFRTPVVGAHLVLCSDEAEVESAEAFQRGFADPLLPALAPAKKGPFRTFNLGGRYEWHAARVAEHHFAAPDSRARGKCLLIKINAHVAAALTPDGVRYGSMERYRGESQACGALHALLAGVRAPYADDLREAFSSDGHDRLATLLDGSRVEPAYRYLFAAVVSALRQARRALEDVQAHDPATPTVYMIVPCVTLNRTGPDAEIVCGIHLLDSRARPAQAEYFGLGDDPAAYRVSYDGDRVVLADR